MISALLDRHRYVLGDPSAHVGYLNCERIADRSHIHGWTVEPHYHEGLSQLFVFGNGGVTSLIDYRRHDLQGPAMAWLPALYTHGFEYEAGMDGWVITVPTVDLAGLAEGASWLKGWIGHPQLYSPEHPGQLAEAVDLARKIEAEHAGQGEERNRVLESLFLLLLVAMHRGITGKVGGRSSMSGRGPDLTVRYQDLLDRHLNDTRSVSDYAAMLSVTPTHLSRTVKAVTGLTAGEIIQDRILLEAKRRLVFTDRRVAEIAYELRFSSPSYFTRFFVARMKETPRAFRAMARGTSASPARAREIPPET